MGGLNEIRCRPVPESLDRYLTDRRRGMGVVWAREGRSKAAREGCDF